MIMQNSLFFVGVQPPPPPAIAGAGQQQPPQPVPRLALEGDHMIFPLEIYTPR